MRRDSKHHQHQNARYRDEQNEDEMEEFWEFLLGLFRRHQRQAVGFRWTVKTAGGTVTFLPQSGESAMALLLTDTQKVTFSIAPVDAKGFAAKVDGAPVWGVSDPTVGTITPAADGLSADFVASVPGVCQVTVAADADLGAGITTINGTADVQVEAGEAVSLTVTAGVPVAQ